MLLLKTIERCCVHLQTFIPIPGLPIHTKQTIRPDSAESLMTREGQLRLYLKWNCGWQGILVLQGKIFITTARIRKRSL